MNRLTKILLPQKDSDLNKPLNLLQKDLHLRRNRAKSPISKHPLCNPTIRLPNQPVPALLIMDIKLTVGISAILIDEINSNRYEMTLREGSVSDDDLQVPVVWNEECVGCGKEDFQVVAW